MTPNIAELKAELESLRTRRLAIERVLAVNPDVPGADELQKSLHLIGTAMEFLTATIHSLAEEVEAASALYLN